MANAVTLMILCSLCWRQLGLHVQWLDAQGAASSDKDSEGQQEQSSESGAERQPGIEGGCRQGSLPRSAPKPQPVTKQTARMQVYQPQLSARLSLLRSPVCHAQLHTPDTGSSTSRRSHVTRSSSGVLQREGRILDTARDWRSGQSLELQPQPEYFGGGGGGGGRVGVGHSRDGGSEDGDSGGLSLPWNPLQMCAPVPNNPNALDIESVRCGTRSFISRTCICIDCGT